MRGDEGEHGLAKTWPSPCLACTHVPVRWRLDCAARLDHVDYVLVVV